MRLVLLDIGESRRNFWPLTLNRPVWELRCGILSLAEKLIRALEPSHVACFVPDYMAAAYAQATQWAVNDLSSLAGDDLLILDGRIANQDAAGLDLTKEVMALDESGRVVHAFIRARTAARLPSASLEEFLAAARAELPAARAKVKLWEYPWQLIDANCEQLMEDFALLGDRGVAGTIEQPASIRGAAGDVYVAPGAVVQAMSVLDASSGPIYIDEGAQIHSFTRIEGPCYVGRESVLLAAKCRRGNSIGPLCRVGGEIEQTIIQGLSNKYHEGFLGHAYVGQWVNLGAMTTNSDLKNDYSPIQMKLEGGLVNSGLTKLGCLIGDHTKTSIGTLFNTGSSVGAMSLLVSDGRLMPRYIPSFVWVLSGKMSLGKGREGLYRTASIVMARRQRQWTQTEQAMWDAIYELTAAKRQEAIGPK